MGLLAKFIYLHTTTDSQTEKQKHRTTFQILGVTHFSLTDQGRSGPTLLSSNQGE